MQTIFSNPKSVNATIANYMTLADAPEGGEVLVTAIKDDDIYLQALRFGIDVGASIRIQKNIGGGPVVVLKNQLEIAIGREIAGSIEVTPRGNDVV